LISSLTREQPIEHNVFFDLNDIFRHLNS